MSDVERLPTIARVFDASVRGYHPTSRDHNELYVMSVQTIARRIWHMRGHLLLNQVYDLLGFRNTRYGHMCGWERDLTSNIPTLLIRDYDTASVLIDFNPDGIIWNYIK